MRNILLLSIFILTIIGAGCKQYNRKKKIEDIVDNLIEKEIIFPDSIITLTKNTIELFEKKTNTGTYKILYNVSGDCQECIYNLNEKVLDFLMYKEELKLEVLIVVSTTHFDYFKKVLYPMIKLKDIPLIIDKSNQFINLNNLYLSSQYSTLLLDSNYKVLLIGDPATNDKIKELYKMIIMKQ